jgi:hypothetical protein
MNRKLHNTILAFSVTGMMLAVGLVIAEPAMPGIDADAAGAGIATLAHDVPAAHADQERLDVAVRAFEAELAQAADPAEALALTAGLIAVTATEVALQSALGELRREAGGRELARAEVQVEADPPRPARRGSGSRDVIAVPYFSFARGSRGARS